MSANWRMERRTSIASRRPCSSASLVPSQNKSSGPERNRSLAALPSSSRVRPRTTATGTSVSLPLTKSAAAEISSAMATSVT
ncbi:Uncharacterised protein [Mycobacteroides abscessus subsp. abscessus]|nr:Uncharacterised protein [Mycobacteroides abscessus subsp. abscessus]